MQFNKRESLLLLVIPVVLQMINFVICYIFASNFLEYYLGSIVFLSIGIVVDLIVIIIIKVPEQINNYLTIFEPLLSTLSSGK